MNLKLTKQNTIIAVILGMAVIDIIVQYVTKIYHSNNKTTLLVLVLIGYVVMGLLTLQLSKVNKLTVAYMLHLLSHFIVAGVIFFISKFLFHEKYSKMELIGLLFGFISMYILTFKV